MVGYMIFLSYVVWYGDDYGWKISSCFVLDCFPVARTGQAVVSLPRNDGGVVLFDVFEEFVTYIGDLAGVLLYLLYCGFIFDYRS